LSDVAELVTCAGKPIFVVDASDQHAAKAARSIQGAWKAVQRCGKRAAYESPRHSRAASRSPLTRSNAKQVVVATWAAHPMRH